MMCSRLSTWKASKCITERAEGKQVAATCYCLYLFVEGEVSVLTSFTYVGETRLLLFCVFLL